jgi:hypothetical protein
MCGRLAPKAADRRGDGFVSQNDFVIVKVSAENTCNKRHLAGFGNTATSPLVAKLCMPSTLGLISTTATRSVSLSK